MPLQVKCRDFVLLTMGEHENFFGFLMFLERQKYTLTKSWHRNILVGKEIQCLLIILITNLQQIHFNQQVTDTEGVF